KLIIFIKQFNKRRIEWCICFNPESSCDAACSHIPDDNLQRDDFCLMDKLFSFRKFFNKVCLYALFIQYVENVGGDFIVQTAFSGKNSLFLPIKCRCIIFVIKYELPCFILGLINPFYFALV